MDLQTLTNATRVNQKSSYDTWFPPEYSRSEPKAMRQRQEACKSFIFGPLRTHDITDDENPIKPVPRIEYLELMLDSQLREPFWISPKVRRMIQTLSTEGRCLWGALERPYQRIPLINQSLEEGESHIETDIKGVMYETLPADIRDQFQVADAKGQFILVEKRKTSISGRATWFKWDSWIKSFPATARALRGQGASGMFWDEFSTHPNTRASLESILPIFFGRTMKRNWIILLGTVNPDTPSGRHFMELYGRDDFRRARMCARYGIEYAGNYA